MGDGSSRGNIGLAVPRIGRDRVLAVLLVWGDFIDVVKSIENFWLTVIRLPDSE